MDDEHRELYGEKPPVDDVEYRLDGSHLVELWTMRAPFYPKDVDLLNRFIVDALKAGDRAGRRAPDGGALPHGGEAAADQGARR